MAHLPESAQALSQRAWRALPLYARPRRWALLGLLGLLVIVAPLATLAATGNVGVAVSPAVKSVEVNADFTVAIYVDAGANLVNATDIHLTFDPTYLRVTQACTPGTALTAVAGNMYNNDLGTIDFGAYKPGGSVSGEFVLCTLHFRALQPTTGTLIEHSDSETAPLLVVAPNGTPHTAQWTDGRVIILPASTLPAPSSTPTLTATPTETATRTPTVTPTETATRTPTVPSVRNYLPLLFQSGPREGVSLDLPRRAIGGTQALEGEGNAPY